MNSLARAPTGRHNQQMATAAQGQAAVATACRHTRGPPHNAARAAQHHPSTLPHARTTHAQHNPSSQAGTETHRQLRDASRGAGAPPLAGPGGAAPQLLQQAAESEDAAGGMQLAAADPLANQARDSYRLSLVAWRGPGEQGKGALAGREGPAGLAVEPEGVGRGAHRERCRPPAGLLGHARAQ